MIKNVRISVSPLKYTLKKQRIDLASTKRCSAILNYSTIGGIKKGATSQDDTVTNRKDSVTISEDDDPDYEGETDPFLRTEIKKYNSGKRWLARMMGEDPETFTQNDIDKALKYLLPSHLFAKDARPIMKHPYEMFPKRKESEFDEEGRPKKSAFYTGRPNYYDLTYHIWNIMEQLKKNSSFLKIDKIDEFIPKKNESLKREPQMLQWMKQFQLEEKLNEKLDEKLYDAIIFRLKKLSNHGRASELQSFLSQFQVPVYTPGKEDLKEVELYDNAARSMGYRKTAIAEVIVKEGTGKFEINNQSLYEFFPFHNEREQLMYPLLLINELERFDIEAHVIGGGRTGKAGAIRLGMSRAVAALCPEHFDALNKAGLLMKDNRLKERQKPGRKGARRAFQWVKR